MNLVIKDAGRQIIGRVGSALVGFLVIKIISPYLGVLRYGDYSTIIAYFAIWSAFADFGVYVIGLKKLGEIKNASSATTREEQEHMKSQLSSYYSKFFSTRIFMIGIVYILALAVAYMIPSYRENPYLFWALPWGMAFSALFMLAGILQTPLQLYWKMEQVSIGLLIARISQIFIIIATVYIWFVSPDFSIITHDNVYAFVLIIVSLVVSAAAQGIYVHQQAKKYIALRWLRDRSFTKDLLRSNWKYGFAYYLSSFHTLIVTILLSIFFATTSGFDFAGTWGLALQLVTILLIVPSALGNSLIHKLASASLETKKTSFGGLLQLVFWIGCLCIVGFSLFGPHIINFIGGSDYLSTPGRIGSDFLLPFLGIVLTLSFVKQVFNYIFVSHDLQNKLLGINLFGVVVGCVIGIPLVLHYHVIGGIIMQILLEVCFLGGAIYIAQKHKVLPHVSGKHIAIISLLTLCSSLLGRWRQDAIPFTWWIRMGGGILFVSLATGCSYVRLRRIMKIL